MSKHTPGPWNRYALESLLRFGRKNGGPWDDIELWPDDDSLYMPDDDDTDLIAAAPLLLQELEYALGVADENLLLGQQWRERVRSLIAKARGGE